MQLKFKDDLYTALIDEANQQCKPLARLIIEVLTAYSKEKLSNEDIQECKQQRHQQK